MLFLSQTPLLDVREGVRLCGGNSAMHRRMLHLFSEDPSFFRLKSALRSMAPKEAFLHAHTLKGLSAQLALPRLHSALETLCDVLRGAEENAASHALIPLPELEEIYLKTLEEIDTFLSQPLP